MLCCSGRDFGGCRIPPKSWCKPATEGADPGHPTLAQVAEAKHQDVAERLRAIMDLERMIAAGDPEDHDLKVLFLASAACGWEEILQLLLERGCSPNVMSTNLAFAIMPQRNRDYRTPHYRHPTALALAAYRGHLGIVKLLLRRQAWLIEQPSDGDDPDPLALAIEAGHSHLVSAFLDSGANPDYRLQRGPRAISTAVRWPEVPKLLLD